MRARLAAAYHAIRADCAITTAADAAYAPYLLNMLRSLRSAFPDHPHLYVFDLGMDRWQRAELAGVPWITFRRVPPFCAHWKRNWTWKHYIALQPTERFRLHLDSGMVVRRSLANWFLVIARCGYLGISQEQPLADITPSLYWRLFSLDPDRFGRLDTVGAGLFGFDAQSLAGDAVREAFAYAKAGWTLGSSPGERNPVFDYSVPRDCPRFRHDQTLLNLALRRRYGQTLQVRRLAAYAPGQRPFRCRRAPIWWARRAFASLTHFGQPLTDRVTAPFLVNRARAYGRLWPRWVARSAIRAARARLG